tara:strand:- start:7737 stop:8165 length:429 start_codon:yes stop_codon:yes gene_type:complete
MKKAILLLITLFIVSIIGCSTSESTVDNNGSVIATETVDNAVVNQPDNFRNLVDFLYRISGVNITGPSSNPTITVRGVSSINSGIEPLYVIDGQAVGTNYLTVNGMLNVRDIAQVHVLKGSDASLYGVRGANGVIVITTRRQ